MRVVSADGTVVRGTILSAQGGGTEFPNVGRVGEVSARLDRRRFRHHHGHSPAGDRVTIMLGYRPSSTLTVPTASLRLGDLTASTDLSETEGVTADNLPWYRTRPRTRLPSG